jgi:ribonucleoside-diphosphate reductase alpha chain
MSETVSFQDSQGRRYDVTLGYRNDGALGEVFLTGAKSGSDLDIMMRDAAIACSLALQHGVPVATLRRAFLREEDGRPAGPLAQVFDLIAEETKGETQ